MRHTLAAILCLAALAVPAAAQDRVTLGWGRLFNNDQLGDGEDRWRTGSYTLSLVRGSSNWTGRLPATPGEIMEYRWRSEIISPANLANPDPADRRFVGSLSFGVHTHFQTGPIEAALGMDVIAVGPQTGVGRFQRKLHEALGLAEPDLDDQIPNAFFPTLTAEGGHTFRLGEAASVRPFIEGRAGAENLIRVGGDFLFGRVGQSDLMLRDITTGQRYRATFGGYEGFSLSLGGDVAKVFKSQYLPESLGYELTDSRVRLRAGLHWQRRSTSIFYGVTWLGEEFVGQPEGQVVGSVRLKILF